MNIYKKSPSDAAGVDARLDRNLSKGMDQPSTVFDLRVRPSSSSNCVFSKPDHPLPSRIPSAGIKRRVSRYRVVRILFPDATGVFKHRVSARLHQQRDSSTGNESLLPFNSGGRRDSGITSSLYRGTEFRRWKIPSGNSELGSNSENSFDKRLSG